MRINIISLEKFYVSLIMHNIPIVNALSIGGSGTMLKVGKEQLASDCAFNGHSAWEGGGLGAVAPWS